MHNSSGGAILISLATAFADVNLLAGGPNIIAWIILGGLAGWITGRVMGGGYGFIGDIILGLIGALVGGFVTSLFITGDFNFIGSLIIAVLGSVVVVAIWRALTGAARRTSS
jgi:uncharacterized membrane protein YeaQ/YmgE (transglycosylase-associated protein family)